MKKVRRFLVLFFLPLMMLAQDKLTEAQTTPTAESYFKPLKYRSIGPFRGGRSVASAGVKDDPLTYYSGITGGGLWKTEDGGQRWNNISDGYFKTGSVGAVAVSKSNTNIVYCGMGEHAPRGVMTHHGDGVYKSIDAGKTWKQIGLEKTQHIARIVIHPKNPDIVYVAVQGNLYGSNPERGIYKSIDGGKTWNNILFVNDSTGAAELSMDANNPNILYAAMWEHQRTPWQIISGGEGSGLYKSMDGGETWKELTNGLPKEKGKMAIAVSPTNSDKVYALVESDSQKDLGGLFVSNDAGANWSMVSGDNQLTQRAWYYTELFIDPKDENTVFVLSAHFLKSIDGGKSWEHISGTHMDFHDLWINPDNPKNLCVSNDGGPAISFNGGKTWSRQDHMPTGQFYRVIVDNQYPYHLYAGQQDYPALRIASKELKSPAITQKSVENTAGNECAFVAFDPDDPSEVMGTSVLGMIDILDVNAQATTNIGIDPSLYMGRAARDQEYLFNWNAPLIWSQHETDTYYHGAQMLLRTRDDGATWVEVSPDLTRNQDEKQGLGGAPYTNEAVGAENYGTLSYIMESPHEAGVIWTGSDDGLVQITKDYGKTWSNITPKGLKECLINSIEVSPHDPATAYIATTRYKFNDHTPALYKTTDYGKTWTNVSGNIPIGAFTRVVREDEKIKGLLVVGTETGIYISWNDGKKWESLQLNLPVCPITDITLKHDDMIISTSGRSFWILDDIEVLRQYEPSKTDFNLYQPEEVMLENHSSPLDGNTTGFTGATPFVGVNPANGAVIYYELPKLKKEEEITLKIKGPKGKFINEFTSVINSTFQSWAGGHAAPPSLSKNEGLNRFVWDLRHPTMTGAENVYMIADYRGHKVSPGTYSLELEYGSKTLTTQLIVKPNPLYPTTAEEYKAYSQFMRSAEDELRLMHEYVNMNKQKLDKLNNLLKELEDDKKFAAIKKEAEGLLHTMKIWDEKMVQRKSVAYDDTENFENKFTAEWLFMLTLTQGDIPKLLQSSIDRRIELETTWNTLKTKYKQIMETDLPKLNKAFWEAGLGAL